MFIKLKPRFSLSFGWPVAAIVLLAVTIGSVQGEPVSATNQHHEMSSMVVQREFGFFKESSLRFLASAGAPQFKHTKGGHYVGAGFLGWLWDRAKDVVNTGIDQVKSIVSGTKNLVTAGGQIIGSALAYATGNKELGDKLANDAANSVKQVGNDAIDLLASGGNLYNKTAEELNEVVPHLGTLAGMLVSFTPIGPEVALARGFADVKNAYEKGGMNAALQAAAFAALDAAPGGAGKAAKAAKEARAAENAAGDLAHLSALFKQAGNEAKVAHDATKLNKFIEYVDKLNKLAKPAAFVGKGFVPDRDRDKDGKLLSTGGSDWENRRDAASKMPAFDGQKAKDKAAQPRAAQNFPAEARPRNVPGAAALRPSGGARLDSVDADEPVRNRDAEQADRDRAYNQERQRLENEQRQADLREKQRLEDERRQADLREKQRLEDEQRQADLSEKQRLQNEKRLADLREKEHLQNEQRQADLKEKQRLEDEQRQADLRERQRIADEKHRADQEEKQRIDNERIADQKRQAAEDEKRRADQEEKQRLDNERIADQKRKAEEEERERLEQQRIAEQQREVEQEDKERLAEEKRQAAAEEKQRLADEQRRTQEETAAAQSKTNQMQATHTEDEEVQAQKEYLSKLRAREQQNQQPRQKASPAEEDQSDDGQNE